MDTFYTQLKRALETAEGDIWTETVLEGEYRGEKRLLTSEPDEKKDSPRVYCERVSRTPRLIICGGGHVSMPIIRLGKMLGFAVTVIEDRPKFADNARAAGADMVVCQPFASALSQIRGDSDSWFIIVTRGHRYDTECLDAILQKKYAYVGMMGSRRTSILSVPYTMPFSAKSCCSWAAEMAWPWPEGGKSTSQAAVSSRDR